MLSQVNNSLCTSIDLFSVLTIIVSYERCSNFHFTFSVGPGGGSHGKKGMKPRDILSQNRHNVRRANFQISYSTSRHILSIFIVTFKCENSTFHVIFQQIFM